MLIRPDWNAPANVRAYSSTRVGGVSVAPYTGLNISDRVGDRDDDVRENRRRLYAACGMPDAVAWLALEHGTRVVAAENVFAATTGQSPSSVPPPPGVVADASFTRQHRQVCLVTTADCLPVLLCDRRGSVVASIHCGWRGLCSGIIEATLDAIAVPAGQMLAWLGPCVGADVYEVGEEVKAAFVLKDARAAECFKPSARGRWLADLQALAEQRLAACDVSDVTVSNHCTLSEPRRFFSYRRDGITGRMATFIWIEPPMA